MTSTELINLVDQIKESKYESRTLEIKAAEKGSPTKLYDTLSSFSNQDEGGTIIFGIDENNSFEITGVYDAQDLEKKIAEQCEQMSPIVRPVTTIAEHSGKTILAAEIPGMDITQRPCYYKGKGIRKGSYIRVGESDKPMTDYEIYSYEAFRKHQEDDSRIIKAADISMLDQNAIDEYLMRLRKNRPNLSRLDNDAILSMMGFARDGHPSLSALMLFSVYPQAVFQGLCITAVSVYGTEMGETGPDGERFMDSMKIEGTIQEMLDDALLFVQRNMKTSITIDEATGKRTDRTEYPVIAIREAILNALSHRDYSFYSEEKPITIRMFEDRMEIANPGGLYGRLRLDELGHKQPDTRNPQLVSALEILDIAENRYSGIPTMRRAMQEMGLREPEFISSRETFSVTFYKERKDEKENPLIRFCSTPRTRNEIADFLGLKSVSFAISRYIEPLIMAGSIRMTRPDKPGSRYQKYYAPKE